LTPIGFTANAGVVAGEVQAAKRFDGTLDQGFNLRALRHVARDEDGLAALFFDQPDGFFAAVPGDVTDDHFHTLAGERQRDRPANAGARTGDDSDFVLKTVHVCHAP